MMKTKKVISDFIHQVDFQWLIHIRAPVEMPVHWPALDVNHLEKYSILIMSVLYHNGTFLMKFLGLGSRLAFRAEVCAAVADNYPLNRGATERAELTTQAVGNLELKVGRAQCSIGPKIAIHAGSLIADS